MYNTNDVITCNTKQDMTIKLMELSKEGYILAGRIHDGKYTITIKGMRGQKNGTKR